MQSMTSHERILHTIRGEAVNRVPVFAPLTWNPLTPQPPENDWKNGSNYRRLLQAAQETCDFYVQLEIPECQPIRGSQGNYGMHGIPEGIFDRRFFLTPPEYIEMNSQDWRNGRQQSTYMVHTPGGMLTTTEAVQPGEDTVWEIEPLIKNVSDAEKLLSIPYEFERPDMRSYFAQRMELGQAGVAVCFVTTPLVMVSRLTGFQRFLEWTITERDLN